MKKVAAFAAFVLFTAVTINADLLLTETADLVKKGSGEIGIALSYEMDAWTIKDFSGSPDYSISATKVEAPVKYGLTDKIQLNLSLPFTSWKYEVDPDSYSSGDSDSGIGQVGIGGKLSVSENAAIGINLLMPTADVDKGLGEGMDAGVMFILSKDLGKMKLTGNAGYIMKMAYEDKYKTEWNPADPIVIRAGIEYPLSSLSLIGEIQGQLFGKAKYTASGGSEKEIDETNGTTIDLIGGAQYKKDNIRLKAGLALALGSEDYRAGGTFFRFLDSWDYKIFLSCAYLFGE